MLKIDKPVKRKRKKKEKEKLVLSSMSDGTNALTFEFCNKQVKRIWYNNKEIAEIDLVTYLHKLSNEVDFDSLSLAVFIAALSEKYYLKFRSAPFRLLHKEINNES